jgi:truncated hemoglobin YjbI
MASLYDRLGGYQNIEKIVSQFYQTILNDDEVNVFYLDNVSDIAVLHHTVTDFFALIFGGPNIYKGKSMVEAHKHMAICQKDFDSVWKHMEMSFEKYDIHPDIIRDVKEVIYSFTQEIITKK